MRTVKAGAEVIDEYHNAQQDEEQQGVALTCHGRLY